MQYTNARFTTDRPLARPRCHFDRRQFLRLAHIGMLRDNRHKRRLRDPLHEQVHHAHVQLFIAGTAGNDFGQATQDLDPPIGVATRSDRGHPCVVHQDLDRAQRRGGKGVIGMKSKEEKEGDDTGDFVEHLFSATTHDYLMFFTNTGRVYVEKVYEIPEMGRTARGKSIANILALQPNEKVAALICVQEFSDKQHLVMATASGIVKKTNLADYSNFRKGGIIGIKIEAGDELIGCVQTNGKQEIVLVTKEGMSLRFDEEQLRDQGRATVGVYGIRPEKKDKVVGVAVVDAKATLLVVGENGVGKRTSFEDYRSQTRGGKGIITMKTTDKTGMVAGAISVKETDEIMLITVKGQMVRTKVKDIRATPCRRSPFWRRTIYTQGVYIVRLQKGDRLQGVARVVETDDEDVEGELPLGS